MAEPRIKLAAIGQVTADALRHHGLTPTVTAEPYTIKALVEAMAAYKRE